MQKHSICANWWLKFELLSILELTWNCFKHSVFHLKPLKNKTPSKTSKNHKITPKTTQRTNKLVKLQNCLLPVFPHLPHWNTDFLNIFACKNIFGLLHVAAKKRAAAATTCCVRYWRTFSFTCSFFFGDGGVEIWRKPRVSWKTSLNFLDQKWNKSLKKI